MTDRIIDSIFDKASQKFLKGFFVIVQKYSLPLSPIIEQFVRLTQCDNRTTNNYQLNNYELDSPFPTLRRLP